MSIYDNLADSDYIDHGKFKEQLKKMSQLQESSEGTMERREPYANMNDHPILQTNDNQFDLAEDSVRRQKINQEENPMDQENEQSLMRNARLNQPIP